jgi:hypothetical protein
MRESQFLDLTAAPKVRRSQEIRISKLKVWCGFPDRDRERQVPTLLTVSLGTMPHLKTFNVPSHS